MNLRMPGELAENYKSAAQRARVVSEAWGEENLFCPNCTSRILRRSPHGTQAVDYTCPRCDSPFQLKSASHPFADRIVDAAFDAMRRAIIERRTPNLLALHYEPGAWVVRNLVLIPAFVFSISCLEKRPPLGPNARRAGWVGCNILLTRIPHDARIELVADGKPQNPMSVREQYARLRPLAKRKHDARGWTMDVLNVVRRLGKREFSLAEAYSFADELAQLHPQNHRIEPKIRQQLQVLREMRFIEFLGRGNYRVL